MKAFPPPQGKDGYLHQEVTSRILACYYKVFRAPASRGLNQPSLVKALAIELKRSCLDCRMGVRVVHRYGERVVGMGRLDLLVAGCVALEVRKLVRLRRADSERLRACLLHGGFSVGLLLNFGASGPQVRRVFEGRHARRPGEQAGNGQG